MKKDLLAIHEFKQPLILDKPIYVGCSILDLTKLSMYKFNHEHFRIKFDNRVKLLFTYTDRLVFGAETNDVYEDFYKNKNLFDFSNYP